MGKKKYEVQFGGSFDGSGFMSEEKYYAGSALEVAQRIKAECLAGLWAHHSKKDFEAGKAWFCVSDEGGEDSMKVESLDDLQIPKAARSSAWNKAKTKAVIVRFNKQGDREILAKLDSVANKTDYIRDLIAKDIAD